MPIVVASFVLYALFGEQLPFPGHRSYEVGRLVGHLYMTLEAFSASRWTFLPRSSSSSTIYGGVPAILRRGQVLHRFSFSAMGASRPAPAAPWCSPRSFSVDRQGAAWRPPVTCGPVAYPMLAGRIRQGRGRRTACGGGVGRDHLASGARRRRLSHRRVPEDLVSRVLLMATIPTLLYYFALFLMVEIDARKFGMSTVKYVQVESLWSLTKNYGSTFCRWVSIVRIHAHGIFARAVGVLATVFSFATSFLHAICRLFSTPVPRARALVKGIFGSKFFKALEAGSTGGAQRRHTLRGAGIIVGVVTLTGLGLKFSSIIIDYAAGSLLLTAIYTSLIVWIVGLAVPVTASYIICRGDRGAGADQARGAGFRRAHVHLLLRGALRGVAADRALAVCRGGDHRRRSVYKTTLQSWKYTLPAFLVPFMFVLDPSGVGLLLTGSIKTLGNADWGSIAVVTVTAALGIASLAGGVQAGCSGARRGSNGRC